MVGPGKESFTRIMPPFFTAPSGQVVGVTERTVKSWMTSRGASSAAATKSADGNIVVLAAAAVSLQKSLRVRRLFMFWYVPSWLRCDAASNRKDSVCVLQVILPFSGIMPDRSHPNVY
jgi:hypothetical protein